MKLIDEWKTAYKFASVRVGAIGTALLAGWIAVPAEQQQAILSLLGLNTPAVLGIVGIIVAIGSRVVKTGPPDA